MTWAVAEISRQAKKAGYSPAVPCVKINSVNPLMRSYCSPLAVLARRYDNDSATFEFPFCALLSGRTSGKSTFAFREGCRSRENIFEYFMMMSFIF